MAAAKFSSERQALDTYNKMQEMVFQSDWDLSVYRMLLVGVSHVAAIGEPQQPPEVQEKVGGLLSEGEPATLPPHVVETLVQRRAQAKRIGPWVEGHYRPGRPV